MPKFLTMLSDAEHKALGENVDYWGRATKKEFYELCNIRMGLQSWYRYIRLGDVQSYIDAVRTEPVEAVAPAPELEKHE